MKPQNASSSFASYGLSLLLHALFVLFFVVKYQISQPMKVTEIAPQGVVEDNSEDWVYLDELPEEYQEPKISKQIVESEKADNNKKNPNTRFMGERDQVVKKESVAKSVGKFQKEKIGKKTQKALKDLTLSDLGLAGLKPNPSSFGKESQKAQTDDYLPGVSTGDKTLLGTREVKYFTYYQRVKDLLRVHWKPMVERQFRYLAMADQQVEAREYITTLIVSLNREGDVIQIEKVRGSGNLNLDKAAVNAFEAASPFPNPPEGMIEKQGQVNLNWSFVLTAQAQPVIKFRRAPMRGRRIP